MSTAEQREHESSLEGRDGSAGPAGPELGLAPDPVEVGRRAGLAALVGGAASAVAIAYLARAAATGAVLDWVLVGLLGLLAVVWLRAFLDARTPLLVADQMGVRLRLGRTWQGLPWSAVRQVEHQPRRGWLRDGRLSVVPFNEDRVLGQLDRRAARHVTWARRWYGAPLALPIGLGTKVSTGGQDLVASLQALAASHPATTITDAGAAPTDLSTDPSTEQGTDEAAVRPSELAPDRDPHRAEQDREPDGRSARRPRLLRDPRPLVARALARVGGRVPAEATAEAAEGGVAAEEQALVPTPAPGPRRPVVEALRAEVFSTAGADTDGTDTDTETDTGTDDSAADAETSLMRGVSVEFVDDESAWGERVTPIAREGHAVSPLVLDDFAAVPAEDPVVGPELRAARTRLRLSVEELADRTRIRPHVIEAIEVDDFVPCGGDFYARGHLRTLARVLGIDVAPLLEHYDERYAHAPVDPRRVFEAELATGAHGPIRGSRGGPNWSVLVAAVMAVVLLWSVARLIMDAPTELRGTAPVLNGSGGPHGGSGVAADPVEVEVTAPSSGARVVVRDSSGEVVLRGRLAIGETRTVEASPPLRVQASDGSVTVSVAGKDRGPIGDAGRMAQGTYAAD